LIALMIHTRSLKPAQTIKTTHAIKQAHAAFHTGYSAVARMIRTLRPWLQMHHASTPHASTRPVHPAKSPKAPAKTLAGLTRDLPVRVIILFTMSNNPKRQGQQPLHATSPPPTGKLLLFNEHFFEWPQTRRSLARPNDRRAPWRG